MGGTERQEEWWRKKRFVNEQRSKKSRKKCWPGGQRAAEHMWNIPAAALGERVNSSSKLPSYLQQKRWNKTRSVLTPDGSQDSKKQLKASELLFAPARLWFCRGPPELCGTQSGQRPERKTGRPRTSQPYWEVGGSRAPQQTNKIQQATSAEEVKDTWQRHAACSVGDFGSGRKPIQTRICWWCGWWETARRGRNNDNSSGRCSCSPRDSGGQNPEGHKNTEQN